MKRLIPSLLAVISLAFLPSCNEGRSRSANAEPAAEFLEQGDSLLQRTVNVSHSDGLVIYDVPEAQIEIITDLDRQNEYMSIVCAAAFTSKGGEVCGDSFMDGRYGRHPKDANITGGFIWDGYHTGSGERKQWEFYMGGYEAELSQRAKDNTVLAAFA